MTQFQWIHCTEAYATTCCFTQTTVSTNIQFLKNTRIPTCICQNNWSAWTWEFCSGAQKSTQRIDSFVDFSKTVLCLSLLYGFFMKCAVYFLLLLQARWKRLVDCWEKKSYWKKYLKDKRRLLLYLVRLRTWRGRRKKNSHVFLLD